MVEKHILNWATAHVNRPYHDAAGLSQQELAYQVGISKNSGDSGSYPSCRVTRRLDTELSLS